MGELIGVNPNPDKKFRQTPKHNFTWFTGDPAYRAANRALVREVFGYVDGNGFLNLDMGSGAGLVEQVTAEECSRFGYSGRSLGIDPDKYIVQVANELLYPDPDRYSAICRVGYAADALNILREVFGRRLANWGSMHDVAHEIPTAAGRQKAFNQLALCLAPNGVVSWNSTFTPEAVGGSSRDYARLKKRSFEIFDRSRDKSIEDINRQPVADYHGMMINAGLTPVYVAHRLVRLSVEVGMKGILRYGPFLFGLFRDMVGVDDFSIEQLSEVALKALEELSKERELDFTRRFDEAIAQKS